MERAATRNRVIDKDLASAILQFDTEKEESTRAAGASHRQSPAAPDKAKSPSSSSQPQSFFSETLESFPSETTPSPGEDDADSGGRATSVLFGEALASSNRGWSGGTIAAVAVAVLIAVGVPTSQWFLEPPVADVRTGTLIVVTNPPGAIAVIDGTPRGATPLNQEIAAGPHTVELRGVGVSRTIGVTVSAGGRASQYIDLPGAGPPVGQLNLRSEPSGAFVTIDGVARGTTPIVADLAPGEHTVMLASALGWAAQAVSIESGVMASVAVPATSWSVVVP